MARHWRARFQGIDLWTIASRFPVPVFCTAAVTILVWLLVGAYHSQALPWRHRLEAATSCLVPFLTAAFLYSFAVQLYGEAANKRARGLIAQVVGIAVLAWIFEVHYGLKYLFWPSTTEVLDAAMQSAAHTNPLLRAGFAWTGVLAALAFFPFAAPYLRSGTQPGAFWQFTHKLTVCIITAGIGSGLAFGGIAAVLATAKLLFELDVTDEFYSKGAALAFCFGAPLIVLALTPTDFEETPRTGSAKEFTSRAVSLVVRFILIPLATVLSLMLAAYVLTVLYKGGFKHAKLGLGSLLYGTGVVLTALLALPDEAESRIARIFMRLWPWLLIPPTVLLFPSIFIRISEHGWTPYRYFVFAAGIWMALVMAAGFVRRHDMRTVPVLLTVLFALSAYGPWSVSEVTGRSQTRQLETLLAAKGVLAGGKWQEGKNLSWSYGEQETIITALDALDATSQLHRLKPWFEGVPNSPLAGAGLSRAKIDQQLNVGRYATHPAPLKTYLHFDTPRPRILKVPAEIFLIGPIELDANFSWQVSKSADTPAGRLEARIEGKTIVVRASDGKAIKFDLTAFFSELKEEQAAALAGGAGPAPIVPQARILGGEGELNAKIALTKAELNVTDSKMQVEFYLVFPATP